MRLDVVPLTGILVLAAWLLTACAGPRPDSATGAVNKPTGVFIDGFVIENGLPYPVTDVILEVPATGAFAGCGNILPRSSCRSGFPQADYFANATKVSWKEHGEPRGTDEFVIEVPQGMPAGTVAEVEVVIFAPGQAGARLVRKAP